MKLQEGCGIRAVDDALLVHLARIEAAEKLKRVERQRAEKRGLVAIEVQPKRSFSNCYRVARG